MDRTALHLFISRGFLQRLTIAIAVVALAGCASRKPAPPPPLTPPPLTAQLHYRPAATTQPVQIDPSDVLQVGVEWTALTEMPAGLSPLLATARVIETPADATPIRATGQLTRAARFVPPENIDALMSSIASAGGAKSTRIASTQAVLPRGVTAKFALRAEAAQVPVELDVQRAPPATQPSGQELVDCTVAIDIPDTPDKVFGRERLLLSPVALSLPARFGIVVPVAGEGPSRAILSVIRVETAADGVAQQEAIARCVEDLRQYAAANQPATTLPAGGTANLQAALASLAEPRSTRSTLLYVANETGARLTADVSLAADDATLAEFASRIKSRIEAEKSKGIEPAKLAWLLEASSLEQLSAMQTAEKLPPELAAPLTVFAGEAGRRAASLDELLNAGSIDALRAKVIAENFNYLEDSAPAARVRAFDWLVANGQPLAGYDPLADAKSRRTALDLAITAAAKLPGGAP